jgi:hypothetical protein
MLAPQARTIAQTRRAFVTLGAILTVRSRVYVPRVG